MPVQVEDIMKKQIISIDSSLAIRDAAKMMADSKVGCLVVIDKNKPVGILTERDFVTKVTVLEKSPDTPAIEIMSLPLISINPKETVEKLADLMKEKKIHKVPVVDGDWL
ncbi:MAG: CBS domain-containing protein, partial [Thaumarchaeota archaeon]|nr:CBS domain-containing protein [Nitrososphaerota archaeon]